MFNKLCIIRYLRLGIMLVCMTILSAPAHASNEALLELFKLLRDKGSLTTDEYELLVNTAKADEEKAEDVKAEAKKIAEEASMEAVSDIPKITTKDKIKVESTDGDFEWQFIGRVMADYIAVDEDKTQLESGGELRRARLGMEMTLWKHWIAKVEVDFGNDEVSVKDAFTGYESTYNGGNWWIKVGQHFVPFGFSTMSSSKYMTFMNRPAYADGELQPSRQLGIAGFVNSARWTAHAGIFTSSIGEGAAGEPEDCVPGSECDQEFLAAARVTAIPLMQDKTHLLHLGAGVLYKNPNGGTIDIDQRDAVLHIISNKNLNADFKGTADDAIGFNLETVGVYGPAHLKAEYVNWEVSRNSPGAADVTLDGFSVDLGVFLTGESKNYDAGKAQFGSLKPYGIVGKGGIGAWEAALRFESEDYNDTDVAFFGGEVDLLTFGLNWYVNNTMRFMANYVTTLDFTKPGSIKDGDEPSAFQMRAQAYW